MTVTIQPAVSLDEAKAVWQSVELGDKWELVHHEYVGITFQVVKRRALSSANDGESIGIIQVLVDPVTQHVTTCDQWDQPDTDTGAAVNEDLVYRARQIIAPVVMRKLKLLTTFDLVVKSYEPSVLKPNWLVSNWRRQGLVDGLTGQVAVRALSHP
ncbi:hypothetical protein CKALI_03265 [Corynebacterium kalinowskii]|uniref:Uncharacterized protein n=1 Tax=Corynebacterium kalinowskii TaxID=2675216 RepID=A0A6B8VS05_9CORY|nr:hypothetical protein [Corynebacterium kalinowskii]QGU01536.1 hypothetical protein CKALI_03265 [Corynebacterium kalinowskii]